MSKGAAVTPSADYTLAERLAWFDERARRLSVAAERETDPAEKARLHALFETALATSRQLGEEIKAAEGKTDG